MARLSLVSLLCLAALACRAQAADPTEAEIESLKSELFDNPDSRLTVDEASERLNRLESLIAPKAGQYEQLLKNVRELIGYSTITDQKCRGGESIGQMLDLDAYSDASNAIQPYWAHQASLQLEHCVRGLDSATWDKLNPYKFDAFSELVDSVTKEEERAELNKESQESTMARGVLNFMKQHYSLGFLKKEAAFNEAFQKVVELCEYLMTPMEPWIGIFRVYQPVSGIQINDWRQRLRALTLAKGVSICLSLPKMRDELYELYKPKWG